MPALRERPDELEVYVSRIAEVSGIPADHVEKDFWVTEALRGVALASVELGCSVVFKGGTSLSKAHRLIQRFSEDVDLIAVLPAGSKREHDRVLRTIIETVARTTGIEAAVDSRTATTGVKRSAVFSYPTVRPVGALSSGVLVELGTRGGALPARRLPVQSLLVEHADQAGLPTADRPQGGFAASPAWDSAACVTARRAYEDIVLRSLVWPGAPHSSFEECCELVRRLGPKL